jgi:hypothetical protein
MTGGSDRLPSVVALGIQVIDLWELSPYRCNQRGVFGCADGVFQRAVLPSGLWSRVVPNFRGGGIVWGFCRLNARPLCHRNPFRLFYCEPAPDALVAR